MKARISKSVRGNAFEAALAAHGAHDPKALMGAIIKRKRGRLNPAAKQAQRTGNWQSGDDVSGY